MDERRAIENSADRSADALVLGLRDKRRRFRELLAGQREQLASLEHSVERQIESISAELAASLSNQTPPIDLAEFERERLRITEETQALAQLSDNLDVRQAELIQFEQRLQEQERTVVTQLARQQVELDERFAQLDEAETQLRQSQRSVALSEEELESDRALAAQQRERLHEQLKNVEQEREALATLRSQTNAQRRQIARELDQQRTRLKAEIAKTHAQLKEQEQAEAEQQRRRAEFEKCSTDTHGELRSQLAKATADLQSLRAENERLAHELANVPPTSGTSDDELVELHEEIQSLRAQLREAQARPAASDTPAANYSEVDAQKFEDLQRRFEMAIEDVREQKRRNAVLEERLANASGGGGGDETQVGAHCTLDWEAQKRRLLKSLEAHTDEEEQLSIEGTIRITDEIVGRKDQEIHELKRLLEEQSSNLGGVAIGAAAIADLLNQDELVAQEREKLQAMQDEWREKLRQAEIDISVERARMAREHTMLEEKMQTLEVDRRASDKAADDKLDPSKAAERRWWARVGVKDHGPK